MPGEFDAMNEVMKIMRMMEFMREHKRQQEIQGPGAIAGLSEDQGGLEDIELAPAEARAGLRESLLSKHGVLPQYRTQAMDYLTHAHSRAYQREMLRFGQDVEKWKSEADELRNMPREFRSTMKAIKPDITDEELDRYALPYEQKAQRGLQHLLGASSRLAQALADMDPSNPQAMRWHKELEATTAFGLSEFEARQRAQDKALLKGGAPGGPPSPGSRPQPGMIGAPPNKQGVSQNPSFQDPRTMLMRGASQRPDIIDSMAGGEEE